MPLSAHVPPRARRPRRIQVPARSRVICYDPRDAARPAEHAIAASWSRPRVPSFELALCIARPTAATRPRAARGPEPVAQGGGGKARLSTHPPTAAAWRQPRAFRRQKACGRRRAAATGHSPSFPSPKHSGTSALYQAHLERLPRSTRRVLFFSLQNLSNQIVGKQNFSIVGL